MPILRIIQEGFEGFTGMLGEVDFKNGISVEVISKNEAARMAGIMGIVEHDTGRNPSKTQDLIDDRNKSIREMKLSQMAKIKKDAIMIEKKEAGVKLELQEDGQVIETKPDVPEEVVHSYDYSIEELTYIADNEGIYGIRDFAAKYDIRGPSIKAIIDSLMAVQKKS